MKIFVKAKPLAREEKIKKLDNTHFEVSVTEPPVRGAANRAIIRALADYFKINPSLMRIISGYASRSKIIEIE